ncbi:YoaK family protein [Rhodanobacter sp. AS-Z3]|uniref:YoaK family protein n=1 Tax=Rhodanobacter sp. AS-Z3 TaxID=3031330 RepID=UPI0024788F91|nr:YoaK family protein [Rhodanobacter sp. AS-Z3]WEN13913.1 YoaK family protein [Rhodanobacter sp. AS-Z3]
MPVLRQLPRWAWYGTGMLAFIAGMVNASGYLGFRHESISNMTGNTSLLGIALGGGNCAETIHWALAIAAFVLGAMLSGVIVQQSTLKLGRRYGVALVLESLLLFAAVPLLAASHSAGLYLASVGMGLQNGIVSAYSGAIIRTTHVTGIFTDLGIYIGHLIRGLPVDMLRLRVCIVVALSFMLGSAAGALLFGLLQERTLLVPAVLTGLSGLSYTVYSHLSRRTESSENS